MRHEREAPSTASAVLAPAGAAGPADLLARRAAALTGMAVVLLLRDGWLVPAAAVPAMRGAGPLALGDPALSALAPVRALAERQPVTAPAARAALWPPLARPHAAYPLLDGGEPLGVLLVAGGETGDAAGRAAVAELAVLGAKALSTHGETVELPTARQFAALQQIGRAATPDGRLDGLVRTVAEVLGVRASAIHLPDDAHQLVVRSAAGLRPDELPRLAPGGPLAEEIAWVYLHGQARLVADGRPGRLAHLAGGRQVLLAPLTAGAATVGVLALFDPQPDRPFEDADVRLATAAGGLIGAAIQAGRAALSAREAEARLTNVIEASPDAVILIDSRQTVLRFNAAAAAALHLPAEAVGQPLATALREVRLLHRDGEPATLDDLPLLQALRRGAPVTADLQLQPAGVPAVRYRCQAVALRDAGGQVTGAVSFDRALTAAPPPDRLAAALAAIAEAAAAQPALDRLGPQLVAPAAALIEADAAVLWRYVPAGDELQRLASQGLPPDAAGPERLPLDSAAVVARAGRTMTTQVVEEVPVSEPAAAAGPDQVGTAGFASGLFVPLALGQRRLGVLALLSRRPRRFSEAELSSAQALAVQIALALDYSCLMAQPAEPLLRDDFVSIASHELKTPLTSIKGYAELIARRLARDGHGERHQGALAVISQQIDRMSRLINDLLALSRYEAGGLPMEPVLLDLCRLVQHAVDRIHAAAPHHQFTTLLPPPPVLVRGDPDQLEQALGNLLSNAVKFSPAGSRVTVRLSVTGGEAIIAVEDQGVGIPREQQARLFDRYYRVPGIPGAGLGIGLFIARQIAVRHGGRLSVASTPGQGSTFSLALPLAQA